MELVRVDKNWNKIQWAIYCVLIYLILLSEKCVNLRKREKERKKEENKNVV